MTNAKGRQRQWSAFPNEHTYIWRPQEEYSIKLDVTKLTINEPTMDDQFVLEPPSGAGIASR
jgi:hypothetical protein